MDGIKRKNTKTRKKRTIKTRSLSDTSQRNLFISSTSPKAKTVKRNKTHQQDKIIHSSQKINRKSKQQKTHFFFNKASQKIIIIINKKWFKYFLKVVFIFGILMLVLSSYDSTHITLRSHLEYIEINESISAKRAPKESELGFEIIAVTDEVSLPIIASGKRPIEYYARGTVTILNNYSSEPQRLLPETRFESASGKIFKLGNGEVIVPGRIGVDSGAIEAIIYAEKPGAEYNIDSTDFTIPGFKEANLEDKYNQVYAFSSSSFSEGFIGTESFITKEQQIIVEGELKKQLYNRLILKLEKEKTEKLILIDNSSHIIYRDLISVFSDGSETGLITAKGTIFALGLGNQQLEDYILQTFVSSDDENILMLSLNGITINYDKEDIDFSKQKSAQITISGSPLFSWVIDEENIKKTIAGIKKEELINIFESIKSIDKAYVRVKPFWRNKLSFDVKNITVSME